MHDFYHFHVIQASDVRAHHSCLIELCSFPDNKFQREEMINTLLCGEIESQYWSRA